MATIKSTTSTGTIGAAVTATSWGFDSLTNNGAGTVTYVAGGPHGNASSVQLTQGTGAVFAAWSTSLGTLTDFWLQMYLNLSAYPTGSNHILVGVTSGALQGWAIDINGSGAVVVRGAANTALATMAPVIPLNTWVRLEVHVVQAAGTSDTVQVLQYNVAEATAATADSGVITTDLGDNTTSIQLGAKNATPQIPTYLIANVGVTTTKPAPLGTVTVPPPTVSAGPDVAGTYPNAVQLSGSASPGAGGTLTGTQWVQTSGPACTITNATSLTPTITPPAGLTPPVNATFQITATEA